MNKKSLAITLSKLQAPKTFSPSLEQYQTDSELAAEIVWLACLNKDVKNKTIADLGCGNGIFGIACLLLEAKKVYFIDKDKEMISIAKKNVSDLSKDSKAIFINKDVTEFNKKVDTVIQNPPFGVQKRKADKEFLLKAFEISNKIYSLHKIESDKFILKLASENKFKVKNILKLDFVLKKTMKFHKKPKYKFKVGLWVLEKANRKL